MDAFSVSLADGLGEKNLNAGRTLLIAGVFAVFQFAMPMAGWLLIHTAEEKFAFISMFIPWAALLLLVYIGGKMLLEGIRENREIRSTGSDTDPAAADSGDAVLTAGDLIIQGIATSIDALSVGFTIASYSVVTLFICIAGLIAGRQIGTRLAGKASILGGVILIAIGIEIWVKGMFF